jgi:outer membrane immunogenic protein
MGGAWGIDLRTSLIAAIGLAVLASPAIAAPSQVPPSRTWDGLYLGANLGGAWSDNTDRVVGANDDGKFGWEFPGEINSPRLNGATVLGGVQAGYNWQVAPQWVAGVEADIQAGGQTIRGRAPGTDDMSRVMTANLTMHAFGTVRARLGFLATPDVLLYATGGLAWGDVNLSTGLTRPSPGLTGCENHNNNCQSGSVNDARVGWTVGGGGEWKVSGPWSLKAEYLYYDLGTTSHLMTDSFWPSTFRASLPLRGNLVRLGVNYRF